MTPGAAAGQAGSLVRARLPAAALIALAVPFVVLYCLAVVPYWKVTPDSTTYVLGAQSLAAGHGYREGRHPAILFPPGTSALLAPAWALAKSYRALNAELVLFAFGALAICFFWLRDSLGAAGSGVVVLLCLGSTEFFASSTLLLSEIFFVFFSLLALWQYERDHRMSSILAAVAAGLVRTVGVVLAMALLVDSLRRQPRRWLRSAGYALPILFAAAWETRNRRLGWSYTELMTESDPWNKAGGHLSAVRIVFKFLGNVAYGRALEDLLTNGLTQHIAWAVLPGIVLGALLLAGFCRFWRSGKTAAGTYFIFFAAAVMLYWPDVVVRLIFPVLPLAFAYLVAGVQEVAARWKPKWIFAAAGCFLGLYLGAGFLKDTAVIADSRNPPFPNEFVRYPGKDDIQRLACWWKQYAPAGSIYACQQPNVIDILTGREGVHYVVAGTPEELEDGLRARHAGFLILDLDSAPDRKLATVAGRSSHLKLTKQEGKTRLYELTPPGH